MEYYAHTDGTANTANWQPLREHLENVAKLAREFALAARPGDQNFADAAYAAGLLHDLGKYRTEFQEMIRNKRPKGESTRHKQMGALHARNLDRYDLPFVIMGHHGGLPDGADMGNALPRVKEILEALWPAAIGDFPAIDNPLPPWGRGQDSTVVDLQVRLLFSCLVDADWSDTSNYQSGRLNRPSSEQVPALNPESLLPMVQLFIKGRAAGCIDTGVAEIRNEVYQAAMTSAESQPGIFTMTVPTGGGKTLSALAFALAHASRHGLRRVIYVAPYLSIIEQNSRVFREALGPDSENLIIEHHSLADPGGDSDGQEATGSEPAQRVAENWDLPIILTTGVQFYESLFSNNPGRCRKLHNLAQSVIILDECQTLSPSLAAPTCRMLEQISKQFGCSIVLCTATQPGWKKDDRIFPLGLQHVREMIPADLKLFDRLKRVNVNWPMAGSPPLEWCKVAEVMLEQRQALCVVNTKKAARELFTQLRQKAGGSPLVFHLATSMCPAHRIEILDNVKAALAAKDPCLLVSTQLIEAGVDIDFPFLMRELAPLEAIVQAAGRCNREGALKDRGKVLVFKSSDAGLPRDGWYRNGTAIVEQDFIRAGREPDIHDPTHLAEYYRRLYPTGSTDGQDIVSLRQKYCFAGIGSRYRLMDDATTSLLISNWEPARAHVDRLVRQLRTQSSRKAYRSLQRYSVNVYDYELTQLQNGNVVEMNYLPGINRCDLPYDEHLGLSLEPMLIRPV